MLTTEQYLNFNASDFAADESFQDWVFRPTDEDERFWNNFFSTYIKKQKEIEDGAALLRSVHFKEEWPDRKSVEVFLNKALLQINLKNRGSRKVFPIIRWWAAAAVIIILAASGYFLLNRQTSSQDLAAKKNPVHDIVPGGNRAILTLANGSTIVLDTANNGVLVKQANGKIIKLDNGKVAYKPTTLAMNVKPAVEYNTISTPRGGLYQVDLPDGTKAWLNCLSSIRFPTRFSQNERTVDITGEVYFEVKHDQNKPFIVKHNGVEVKVLGTHFNVETYDDAPAVKITLLEGSVKVRKGANEAQLSPGWQAIIKPDMNIIVNKDVSIDEVMAWKNEKFVFDQADIQTVMRKLSRWYDMDVSYNGKVTTHFGGSISMHVPISKVFEMLEMTGGVKFQIEGRKVTVLPGEFRSE